jgi:hypothetical protein
MVKHDIYIAISIINHNLDNHPVVFSRKIAKFKNTTHRINSFSLHASYLSEEDYKIIVLRHFQNQ